MRNELHLRPKNNWMNDPNGLIYHNGLYHVYYQYFPYAPQWGTMHWGHATTKDFYEWEHHDVALFPSIFEDKNGCFSGSAIDINGTIHFYYTGIHYEKQDSKNIHVPNGEFIPNQLLITSEDGFKFDNFNDKKIILPTIEDPNIGDKFNTRDPKVWFHNDNYYMVIGTKKLFGNKYFGGILLYKSINGFDFQLVGDCFDESIGDMWECPDIFTINSKTFLVISPYALTTDTTAYTSNSIVLKANLDYETNQIIVDTRYKLQDIGLDVYASQTFIDEDNNRVMFSWIRMPRIIDNKNGMMTMPRVLREENGELCYSVHNKILDKFATICHIDEFLPKRIQTSILDGDKINIHGYIIAYKNGELSFSREKCFDLCEGISSKNYLSINDKIIDLDIFFDIHAIEIFINNGAYVCTHVLEKSNNEISIPNEYIITKMKENDEK